MCSAVRARDVPKRMRNGLMLRKKLRFQMVCDDEQGNNEEQEKDGYGGEEEDSDDEHKDGAMLALILCQFIYIFCYILY